MTVRSNSAGSFVFVPVSENDYVAHSTSEGTGTVYPTGYYNSTSNYNETWEHPQSLGTIAKYLSKIDPADLKKLVNIFETNARSLEDHLDVAYLKTSGGTVYGSTTLAGDVNLLGTVRVENIPLVSLLPPTASITMYAGATAPPGWLRCNGAAVLRASYPSLFQTIGTQYGAGDGSTTFNLPNLQGKFPLGGTSTRGATGGEENVTLTESQIPSHRHSGTTGGQSQSHNHGVYVGMTMADGYLDTRFNFAGGTMGSNQGYGTNLQDYINETALSPASADHNHAFNTGYTGGGTSHNNMPPYQVVDYIIKT
jgi:microcystin-dependent protein